MSIVCTICQDLVTEKPQRIPEGEVLFILALKCGHLFHRSCVLEWFRKINNGTGNQADIGQCPCCKTTVSVTDGLRIFPSGDEESGAIAEKLGQAVAQAEENLELQEELRQIKIILEDTGCQLQHERLENEILKYEFTQKASELDELRRELEDSQKLKESTENNWKDLVQKLTSEKQQALEKLEEREGCYQTRINELEEKLTTNTSKSNETDALRTQMEKLEKDYTAKAQEYEKRLANSIVSQAEKSCQTDGRDPAVLQARLISYKSFLPHLESEIQTLDEEINRLQIQQNVPRKINVVDVDETNVLQNQNHLMKGPCGDVYELEENYNVSIDCDDKSSNSSLVDDATVEHSDNEGKGCACVTEVDEYADAPLLCH